MSDMLLHISLGALAVMQTAWFAVYLTGPWRATRLGWVWLLKGGLLAVIWSLLFVDETIVNVPTAVWAGLGVAMLTATAAWLWATVRVRCGHPLDD